jgi:hypothetical protein
LGIFTAGGNINMASTQSNGNLEIDAFLATKRRPLRGIVESSLGVCGL